MQEYVDKIMCYYNKLSGIGFSMSDKWLGAILLADLTDNFGPFIMCIEASNGNLKSDTTISKLLDTQNQSSNGETFLSKKFQNNKSNIKVLHMLFKKSPCIQLS